MPIDKFSKSRKKSQSLYAVSDTLDEPQFTPNAVEILHKRYLNKEEGEKNETPKDLLIRVAQTIANEEKNYGKDDEQILKIAREFYQIMARLEFFPNSPTLRGAGRRIHQLAACFVVPIEDSMTGIFDALKNTALIHKGGGGTGFSFGRLRPSGDKVGSTGGVAGGPLSFMNIFDTMAKEVMQGGVRVGANMGILPTNHPDIMKWITCKADGTKFQNFNLSVAVDNDFMAKIKDNKPYDLINPRNGQKTGELKAGEVFDAIVENAWKNGDPGIIFIDKMNDDNPTPALGKIEATNPCGEQPLLPYESCNLGSINLSRFVKNGEIDWEKLRAVVRTAVRFLDNVIDANSYFVPQIEEMVKGNRKIGLGVMGFADLLATLEIPYNSDEGTEMAEEVMKFIKKTGTEMSEELAAERGVFPNWEKSIFAKAKKPQRVRNATVTTIAPTGTLSLLGNCGGGIEPFFSIVYKKKSIFKADGTAEVEQVYANSNFEKLAKERGFYSPKLMEEIAEHSSLAEIDEVPDDIKKVFVTAHDISPAWHIKMQAAFQKYTDNAVSKTINFPFAATVEDIKKAYLLSFKLNCKGLTVYRDGSRSMQVLTTGATEKHKEKEEDVSETKTLVAAPGIKITPRERPDMIRGYTYRIKTAYGKLFITINDDEDGSPFEVFSHLGKAGGFFAAKAEAICRLISLALRSGIDPKEIIDQLKGIRGPTPTWTEDGKMILSLPDAIAQILAKHINKAQANLNLDFKEESSAEPAANQLQMSNGFSADTAEQATKSLASSGEAPACPECGGMLEFLEGCLKCPSCGFSKCS